MSRVSSTAPLTPTQMAALRVLADTFGPQLKAMRPPSLSEFSQRYYYIPETAAPMTLLPHQESILNYAFDPNRNFQTIVYSTVKKSGKTAIGALCARWVTETWGPHVETYCIANDYEQARGRIYQQAMRSVELDPNFNKPRRELPGKWHIIERQSVFLPTSSIIRAVSSDYKGEAGSNPTATFWSELWGYTSEASHRLWDELTPVPTRERSIRFVETYAGFEDESDLLISLYKLGQEGRRLTHDDLLWPFEDQPPIWVNERARLFMYWDEGVIARRMPWQTPQYYEAQAATLRPQAFERLHLNKWTSSVSEFLPIEWWDSCQAQLPPVTPDEPIVLGVDAAVSSDCCGIVAVSRAPSSAPVRAGVDVAVRFAYVWYPPKGGTIDYTETIDPTLRELCARYNVVEIAYDAYQLHKLMTDLRRDAVAWCRGFSQSGERERADKQLYDLIRDRRLVHDGDPNIRDHIRNSAAKQNKDEDTKLRIIKKAAGGKIDLTVCMSMAAAECLRLNL